WRPRIHSFPGKVFTMLVLSRRPGQKVVFPSLGIEVEVLRSRGSVARLGIVAPDDVAVLRDEVLDEVRESNANQHERDSVPASPLAERLRQHELKNQLNQMLLKLELLQRQLELRQVDDPQS